MTFLGGAILWIKAAESGLPATEAVAVTPTTVLITQGAEVAVLAVVAAVAAVGVLFLIDQVLRLRGAFRLSAAKEFEAVLAASVADAAEELAAAQRQRAESRRLADDARRRANEEQDPSRKDNLVLAADQQEQVAEHDQQRVKAAQSALMSAQDTLDARRRNSFRRGRLERRSRILLIGLLLLGGPVTFAAAHELSLAGIGAVLLVAFLGSTLSFLVLVRETWIWFGVASFLTVSTALTASTFIRTKEDLKVEPAAVLREGAGPVCGFFVAQTSDHLYMGTYRRDVAVDGTTNRKLAGECTGTEPLKAAASRPLPARLMSIPIDEVTDAAIGPPLLLSDERGDNAPSRSAAMALDLCERRRTAAPAPRQPTNAQGTGCTSQEIERLRQAAAL